MFGLASCNYIDIGDFLKEEIKGPATFSCTTGQDCRFEEPAMNQLILDIFGDNYITIDCEGGECLHYSQVPGYTVGLLLIRNARVDTDVYVPSDHRNLTTLNGSPSALLAPVCLSFSVLPVSTPSLVLLYSILTKYSVLWYAGRARSGGELGTIRLPDAETSKLMTEHVPATLHFQHLSYTLAGHTILSNVSGAVKPGQVLAIMGASGAGKSTLLDILARKGKRGTVGGVVRVNGREVADARFREVMGFVDQEDTLMRTLTVYETVLYSALLRLPREMSYEAKKLRTLETLNELGILGIKDSRIGDSGE
jgi:hypothetical protein